MANKNYSKYSKNSESEVIETEVTTEVEAEVETEVEAEVETEVEAEVEAEVETEVEEENLGAVAPAIVSDCSKLNVREEANKDAAVLCVINKDEEVQVDIENSTEDFYKITTSNGVEGYCVKNFISIK